MRRRNRSLRVAIVAATLVLALGAAQAAVIPQAKEHNGGRVEKVGPRAPYHGFVNGVSKFFRLGQWLMLYPTAPPVPPNRPVTPPDVRPLGAPQGTMETTARPIADGCDPI